MAKNSSVNLDITPNADGYSIAGGTTPRSLTLTAGNVTLSAGGSNTYTLPAATGTLVSRDSTDTLTNKLISTGSTFSNNIVTANALATNAITLSSITSSTTQTGITSSPVIVTNLTSTVTVPAGGRTVRIEGQVPYLVSSAACTWYIYIYNSATVTGSPIQTVNTLQALSSAITGINIWFEHTPSSGSQSYCIALSCDAGTGNTSGLSSTRLATMTVKVV